MVFPDLDVVAVTTGRDNYPLSKLADYISSSVKSDTAALTPVTESAKLLANKILDGSTQRSRTLSAQPQTWQRPSQEKCTGFPLTN